MVSIEYGLAKFSSPINEIKEEFSKSYKCWPQNRAIQKSTANKYTTVLADCKNSNS